MALNMYEVFEDPQLISNAISKIIYLVLPKPKPMITKTSNHYPVRFHVHDITELTEGKGDIFYHRQGDE